MPQHRGLTLLFSGKDISEIRKFSSSSCSQGNQRQRELKLSCCDFSSSHLHSGSLEYSRASIARCQCERIDPLL